MNRNQAPHFPECSLRLVTRGAQNLALATAPDWYAAVLMTMVVGFAVQGLSGQHSSGSSHIGFSCAG